MKKNIKFWVNYIVLLSLIITFFSCGKSDNELRIEKIEVIEKKNQNTRKELALKYKAYIGWDTLDQYSIWYQNKFINENNLLYFYGKIIDIIREDSNFVIKIRRVDEIYENDYYPDVFPNRDFLANVYLNDTLFSKFEKLNLKSDDKINGAFILKVLNINYLFSENYFKYRVFNGELIDFYLNEVEYEND